MGVYPYIKHDKTVVSKSYYLAQGLDAEWQSQHLKVNSIRKPVFSQLFIICPQGKWYSSQGMGSQRRIFCWLSHGSIPRFLGEAWLLTCVQRALILLLCSLCLQGTAKCSAPLKPAPRAPNYQGAPAVLCGDKALFLEAGQGRASRKWMQGERFVLYFDQRPRHLQGWGFGEEEEVVLGPCKWLGS